jgi:hypothetical protein
MQRVAVRRTPDHSVIQPMKVAYWHGLAAILGLTCLVLGFSVNLLAKAQRRLVVRYGETYSARVLAEVRLAHYIDLVDEKNAGLAAAAVAGGDTFQAESLCLDICTLRNPLCDSILLEGRLRKDPMIPESKGLASAVCSWLKTGRN